MNKYRPYIEDGQEDGPINNKINIHRIINLKKEYQDELKEKKRMLKQALVQSVEQDKVKFFKDKKPDEEQQARREKHDAIVSKNKKRKEKRLYKDKDQEHDLDKEAEDAFDADEGATKKRRRLALYGVKQ